jgi:hypothetical protein
MRTFSSDSNHGPWWGRRLGRNLAVMGLIKLSQPTSSSIRDPSEGVTADIG